MRELPPPALDHDTLMEYINQGVAIANDRDAHLYENCESRIEELFHQAAYEECKERGIKIVPQKQILNYRADFLLTKGETRVVVELDGHHFHEKTKDQAASDKKRDRDITMLGYIVFRFTGSEIFKDARKCAHDVIRYIERVAV
jgi:very-short-patch-repair endonuclease